MAYLLNWIEPFDFYGRNLTYVLLASYQLLIYFIKQLAKQQVDYLEVCMQHNTRQMK